MSDAESKPGQAFDEARLKSLVELMKEHGLCEVELREGDRQIRICRSENPAGYGPHPGSPYSLPAYPPAPVQQPPPAAPAAAGAAAGGASAEPDDDNIVLIKSPMVGTFYSKPNPKAQDYVKVGDHVEPETTVCIIEAMKVFNEIPAEVSGRIVAILVDSEEAVEFGRALFKVDTKG